MATIKTDILQIPLKFTAENSSQVIQEIEKIKNSLKDIDKSGNKNNNSINNMIKDLSNLQKELEKVTKEGHPETFTKSFESAANKYNEQLKKISNSTNSEIAKINKDFESLTTPINKADTALNKLGRTFVNSLRYNIANAFVDATFNSITGITDYLEETDSTLNSIRIVSSKSQAEMLGFLETANDSAREMGNITSDYLKASEIYYQQGLATNEVITRTEATVKSANVAGQDVATTADQITAILNGFNISASETVSTLDKIAAVGAGTATDFEEIAKAAQKVAASASEAGISVDQTLGMIATISSVTREAPETIGTSLNSIISRFNALSVSEGEYTSKIEQAFQSTASGLTIFDKETGLLKDISDILDEVAEKWDTLDINQQKAITSAIAGTRQANRLMSLLGNYDMYKEYTEMSINSEGALEQQNKIYLQSLEAIKNQAQASGEALYNELFDVEVLKSFYSVLSDILDTLTSIVNKSGGLTGILAPLLGISRSGISSILGPSISRLYQNYSRSGIDYNKGLDIQAQDETKNLKNAGYNVNLLSTKQIKLGLTDSQVKQYNDELEILRKQLVLKVELNKQQQNLVGLTKEEALTLKNTLNASKLSEELKNITNNNPYASKNIKSNFSFSNITEELNDEIVLIKQKIQEQKEIIENETDKTVKNEIKQKISELKNYAKDIEKIRKEIIQALETDNITGEERSRSTFSLQDGNVQNLVSKVNLMQDEDAKKAIISNIGEDNWRILNNNKAKVSEDTARKIANALLTEVQAYENATKKETDSTKKAIEANEKKAQQVVKDINNLGKATKFATYADNFTKGLTVAAGGFQFLNTAMNENLSTAEKVEGSLSGIGTMLMAFPQTFGFGIAISTLGPIFMEVFGIGVSELEKLQRAIDSTISSYDNLTSSIVQQSQSLSSVSKIYDTLTEKYEQQAFTRYDLTEEEQSQYDQLADYAAQYTPQLIKYYDAEGKAVLDLSDKYNTLKDSKNNYLEQQLDRNEFDTYSSIKNNATGNAELLLKNYSIANQNIEEQRQKIAELQQRALSGEDVTDALENAQQQLSNYQLAINDISTNWNDLFTNLVTKGTQGFSELGNSLQNSIINLSSYQTYLSLSNVGIEDFKNSIEDLIYVLDNLNEDKIEIFEGFSQEVQNSMMTLIASLKLGREEIQEFFEAIDSEEDIISGTYLNAFDAIGDTESTKRKDEQILSEYQQTFSSNASLLGEDENKVEADRNSILEQQVELLDRINELQTNPSKAMGGITFDMDDFNDVMDQIEELNEAYQSNEEILEELGSNSEEIWQKNIEMLSELARSGPEAFNKIAESYNDMADALDGTSLEDFESVYKDFGYESAEQMQKQMAQMYTVLNGDNEAFYKNWQALNINSLTNIADQLGVYASDYKTYNEYMDALNQQLAQRKVLLETYASEGAAAAIEKLNEFKTQSAIQELATEENKSNLEAYLSLNTEAQKEYNSKQTTISKLEDYKDQLEGFKEVSEGNVQIDAEAKQTMDKNFVTFMNNLANNANSLGLDNLKLSAGASVETYKSTIDTTIDSITKRIDELKNEQQDILDRDDNKIPGLEGIGDLANALIGSLETPTFDHSNFGDLSKFDIKDLSSSVNNNIKEIGGSGTGSAGTEKEIEDLKFELDLLKKYTDRIEEIEHSIDLLSEAKERAYGADYIDNLNKEISLNKQNLEVQGQMLNKIKEIAKEKKSQLSKQGVEFSDTGLIINYNEILQAQEKAVNKLSGDAKEAAKEQAQALKDLMDEYEEYALDKYRETEAEIASIKNELSDLARERIEYAIEIIIDASEKEQNYLDFLMNIEEYKQGKYSLDVDITSSAESAINSLKTIQDIFKQTNGGQDFLNSIFNDENLKDNTQAQLEMISQQQEQMQDLANDLIDFAESFRKAFAGALDEAMEILEEEIEKFDNITYQYERILELSEQLNINSFDELNNIYSNLESIYANNVNKYAQIAQSLKESRDSFTEGSEEWITANEKYLEAQTKIFEEQEKIIELLSEKYDSTVSTGRTKLEEALFGGMTADEAQEALDKITENREKYLDTEEKIYSLSKLERDISEDIDSYEYDPKAQEALKKFMNQELDYLNSKKKITQDDLDLTEKQYNVLKARIELERAYNSEQYTLMLQRNQDGTFGYMYVQNTDGIKEAQQEYEDAINELYEYSMKRTEELQQESIDIRTDVLEEYEKIAEKLKNGTIDQEEAVEQLNKAFDEMKKKLEENAKAQAEMQKQAASAKLLQILGVSEGELGDLSNQSDSIRSIFDILYSNGEITDEQFNTLLNNLGLNANNYIGSVGEKMQQVFNDLGGDQGAMETLMAQFNGMNNSTAAVIFSLLQQTGDLSQLTEEILESSLNGSGEKFDEFLNKISSGTIKPEDLFTESLENGLDSVSETWDTLKDKIILDLDSFSAQFDMENPDSILSQVSTNIVQAYEEYNKALEDSYNSLKENQEELSDITDIYNKNLDKTIGNLDKEIEEVTELTNKYSNLREEIIQVIDEVLKYIDVLNSARNNIEAGNKPSSTTSNSNSNSSSSSHSSSSSNKTNSSSSNSSKTLNNGQRVRIIKSEVYSSAYDTSPEAVYSTFLNSNRTDLYIDGSLNGKKRVRQKNAGYVGWFKPNALQAFHTGGLVDVNNEGLALLKKNETVLTEKQTDIVKNIKEMLDSIPNSFDLNLLNNNKDNPMDIKQDINIQANFPNVTRAGEIEKALETLYINASQYINKK